MIKKEVGIGSVLIIVSCVLVWFAYRGFYGPPRIRIINKSTQEISRITLSGKSWSKPVANLSGNQTTTVVVHPEGESGLKISFSAGSQMVEKDLLYLESKGGYCVSIVIQKNLDPVGLYEKGPCFSIMRAV